MYPQLFVYIYMYNSYRVGKLLAWRKKINLAELRTLVNQKGCLHYFNMVYKCISCHNDLTLSKYIKKKNPGIYTIK